jgi:hypothetical protein
MTFTTFDIIGTVVGFLVVVILGIYIGDQMVQSAQPLNEEWLQPAPSSTDFSGVADFIALCVKIALIVSVLGIVFVLLQRLGLISRGDPDPELSAPEQPISRNQYRTPDYPVMSGESIQKPYHNRFEAILEDESELSV